MPRSTMHRRAAPHTAAPRSEVRRGAVARTGVVAVLVGTLVSATAACASGGEGAQERPPREQPGPTLASAPPPADWKDVHSPTGLVYSVPPEWEIGDPFELPDPADPDGPGGTAQPDTGSDWGSGFVTTANAIADRGYCPASGLSFRTLAGISAVLPGEAEEQAASASRAMADSIDRRFTRNGAHVPQPEPQKIGVSGVPAWHVSLRGQVHPPRGECTPPVIRFDTVAVSTVTPQGERASIVFVLMADEGEEGVQPESTIDTVVASLRYDNSV